MAELRKIIEEGLPTADLGSYGIPQSSPTDPSW
jgi:hypothetical protein